MDQRKAGVLIITSVHNNSQYLCQGRLLGQVYVKQ